VRERETRNGQKSLVANREGRDHLGDKGVNGRVMLKWILQKYGIGVWTEFNWIKIQSSGGLL
jgi:hypothetical protein